MTARKPGTRKSVTKGRRTKAIKRISKDLAPAKGDGVRGGTAKGRGGLGGTLKTF